MCELCDGTYERTLTLEVGRAAFFAQHVDDYGAFHAVVADTNVEDDHIHRAMAQDDCKPHERKFGEVMLMLSEEDRISALAMAQNRYGVMSIHSKPAGGSTIWPDA